MRFLLLIGFVISAGLLGPGCATSFKKAYRAYSEGEYAQAKERLQAYVQHPKYGPAAQYYLAKMHLNDTRDLEGLLLLDRELIGLDSLQGLLSEKRASRIAERYDVDSLAIYSLREETQRWAIAGTRGRGTLPALDSLLEGLPEPLEVLKPDIESTRRDIVNANLQTSDYDTMTAILKRHIRYVLPENYGETRRMTNSLWTAFTAKYAPCEVDRFAREHPRSFAGRDCWLEEVRPLLCAGVLGDMLDFHAQNRWTALEIVLLNSIADLADSTTTASLNTEQQARLTDLRRRRALRTAFRNGLAARDTATAYAETLGYISRYAPRYSAFRLMEEALQFFLEEQHYEKAAGLLEQARPYFPDTLPPGCHTDFSYQRRVKPWIDGKLPILRRPAKQVSRSPLRSLNTPEGDEFNPVVRADGQEILFAAKGRPDNLAQTDVFTARWDSSRQAWESPKRVPALSGAGRQVPLSLSAGGRRLLVLVNGKLHLSSRGSQQADWKLPKPLPVSGIEIMGKGQLSADGNTLVLEGAYSAGTATMAPDLDIFVSQRDPATGQWSRPAALGANINTDGQEASPLLLPDGPHAVLHQHRLPGPGQQRYFCGSTHTRRLDPLEPSPKPGQRTKRHLPPPRLYNCSAYRKQSLAKCGRGFVGGGMGAIGIQPKATTKKISERSHICSPKRYYKKNDLREVAHLFYSIPQFVSGPE